MEQATIIRPIFGWYDLKIKLKFSQLQAKLKKICASKLFFDQ
ncbi:hypothetical protein P872_02985 [Rhodonellum psychrophilum GCM71 = DSM 17998]|uniref:Uncharacterized protein n=2 Tax=Rhodonellum TaxID=336827 RepID=U5C1B4_9BACT|nr:hypothetical protein P872_02985 [Rhodonellum psychrophilum GCM71 = DSM 17998]SDY49462.1 hypothetical protein SAMN05444412_101325 [Rhodonellum ikkaensis]